MKELNTERALAIVFANTKRKKRTEDIVTIAKAIEHLVRMYGSREEAAKIVGLSTEMLRQFLTVLKLSPEVQHMIAERKIDKVEIVRKLATIKDPAKQIEAAKAFVDFTSEDVRDIRRLSKITGIPLKEAERLILESKPKGFHIFMIDFDQEVYTAINDAAKKKGMRSPELVREIVVGWLKKNHYFGGRNV